MHLPARMRQARVIGIVICIASALVGGGAAEAAHGPSKVASSPLEVLPYPGTPDASAQTQIDFPKLSPSHLHALRVKGSRSGVHSGRLTPLDGGRGAAFKPSRPFAGGERVTVAARLAPAGGPVADGRGIKRLDFGFTIAVPGKAARNVSAAGADGPAIVHANLNPGYFTHSFRSEPWLHPPVVVDGNKDPDLQSGDILLDAHRSIQAGPLILDPQGEVLWFDPLPNGQAGFNLSVQPYAGQSVLTFWQGYVSDGIGSGEDVILNHAYQTIATVEAANGYHADLHEFQITPQGNAFITAYAPVQADLSSVGGPASGTVLDSIVQEINIRTGQLLWEWHAYGHVHLAESYAGKPSGNPYDFFHVNSVQQLSNGNILVSARHTFAVYEINPTTGKIVWVLGGKHSSFQIGHGANFSWQHDARMQPNGDITVFDDGDGYKRTEGQSRGMRIRLDVRTRQATLVHQYAHVPPVLSDGEGNLQRLPNGYVFVGFGTNPYFTEFTQPGHQLFTASFRYPVEFYRAFRYAWYGQPAGAPFVAASPTSSGTTVYASWNGATDIASWRVLAGPSASSLSYVAQSPFSGFETAISAPTTQPYIAVQAIGSQGQVLGTSGAVAR